MMKLLCVAVIAGFLCVAPADGQSVNVSRPLKPVSLASQLLPSKPVILSPQPVCWTDWFDRDNPSGTGDWETLYNLRIENPGKICPNPTDIEVQTLSGQSLASTGEVTTADTTTGFICKNKDQSDKYCLDYRVRFSCPPSYCGYGACWTPWYDRDDPSGTGDWETLSSLRARYPKQICETPIYIEVVTVGTGHPAALTGETFHVFNPTEGFVCRKTDQTDRTCFDYKVRFGCCCN